MALNKCNIDLPKRVPLVLLKQTYIMYLSTSPSYLKIGVILYCLLYTISAFGQTQSSDWTLDTGPIQLEKDQRASQFEVATLDSAAFDDFSDQTSSVFLPNPDGEIEEFIVNYTPVVADHVAHLYSIKTYRGYRKSDPSTLLAFDISEQGISAAVLNATQSYFVEPLESETNQYIVYYKKDALVSSQKCALHDHVEDKSQNNNGRKLVPDQKYTFNLAITASGEYSQQFGGSPVNTTMVLNALASGVNMLNLIFLRDLGYELILVTNQSLIFTDPLTDPFDTSNPSFLVDDAHNVISSALPAHDYDIGHLVIWDNLGGLAAISSVCNDLLKGQAFSSSAISVSNLWIDYFAHELGHQFGAPHTFAADECAQSQDGHRFEPGEGSTIMSYAGTCGPPVQFLTQVDPFFHHASIIEMHSSTINNQITCAVGDTTGNSADPIVDAGLDITIPALTPFVLAGRARDLNDSIQHLTYSWEQSDGDGLATMGLPDCTSQIDPLFRYRPPSALPYRSFPEEMEVLAGNNNNVDFEKLACVQRDLNFTLTVRDNNVSFGRVQFDQIFVRVENSGPFNVLSPNGGETLIAGTQNNITWSVNGTDAHCDLVDILLSLDGGMTYNVIANAVANNGSSAVLLPDTLSSMARILISCDVPGGFGSGSTFFDISDDEFKLGDPILIDNDGDNFDSTVDCDDNNPDVYPGAVEICNGMTTTVLD